jgi:hypothetical protein
VKQVQRLNCRVPRSEQHFFVLPHVQTDCRTHPSSYSDGTRESLPPSKWETHHWSLSNAEVKTSLFLSVPEVCLNDIVLGRLTSLRNPTWMKRFHFMRLRYERLLVKCRTCDISGSVINWVRQFRTCLILRNLNFGTLWAYYLKACLKFYLLDYWTQKSVKALLLVVDKILQEQSINHFMLNSCVKNILYIIFCNSAPFKMK